jgi:hypothetical protein
MNEEEDNSLRDDLEKAFDTVVLGESPDSAPDSTPDSVEDSSPDSAPEPEKAVDTVSDAPPNSLSAIAKQKWAETPAEVRADIIRREKETEAGFTRLDEDRQFGKTLKDVVSPYRSMISAEGGTPVTAIQSLLNSAYILRTASPQKKGELLAQLAQEFGADLPNSTNAVQPDSEIAQLKNQIWQLEQNIRQQPQVFEQQQKTSLIKRDIDAFASDPKNIHFEKLKPVMASLLETGVATGLQDAYDKAQWADSDIRSSLQAEQSKALEAKRIADIKAKAGAARKAGGSITGSPGSGQGLNGSTPPDSLRDTISAAWDEHVA